MARPYSIDLRERAAARFGVAASRWMQRVRATGSAASSRMGERGTHILSGPHRDKLLERTATDFKLRGAATELAVRGGRVDYV